eukprot:12416493-Karenia_brevis.AAC.1
MMNNAGTPRGWHQKWMSLCKLTPTDANVSMHESMCHLLELKVCYDQLDAGALASAEVAVRQVQFAEEQWKERILGQQGDMAAQ